MEPVEDVSVADWIKKGLRPYTPLGVKVGELVPEGFEAYARIFHPAYRPTEAPGVDERIAWATIAGWTGRTVHPAMQFHRIAQLPDDTFYNQNPEWGSSPHRGELDTEECLALIKTLSGMTSTPDRCYFCLWDGRAGQDEHHRGQPKLTLSDIWSYWLFQGPIHSALGALRDDTLSANLWWPEDRAWCVTTHVDFTETYVGGSQACIDRILRFSLIHNSSVRSCVLEAVQVALDTRIDDRGDNINPPVA